RDSPALDAARLLKDILGLGAQPLPVEKEVGGGAGDVGARFWSAGFAAGNRRVVAAGERSANLDVRKVQPAARRDQRAGVGKPAAGAHDVGAFAVPHAGGNPERAEVAVPAQPDVAAGRIE